MLRAHLPRVLAALVTGLLLAAGLQAPAEAATKRSVSLSTSTTVAVINTNVVLAGKLSKSPRNSVVIIQRKKGSRWVSVKSTRTTTSAGSYRVTVTVPGSYGTFSYRAVAPAKGKLKRATSATRKIRTLYRTTVTMTASPTVVPAAQNVTVSGTVRPIFPNSLVSLQKFANGRWEEYSRPRVGKDGKYSDQVLIGLTTRLRVVAPALGKFASAVSPERTVRSTPVVEATALKNGRRTEAYSAQLRTLDRSSGTWTATGLPAGLSIGSKTGLISGTPTGAAGTYPDVQIDFVQDGTGLEAPTRTVSLVLAEAPAEILTTALPNAVVGSPYSTTLTNRGNVPGTWTIPSLPAGLSFSTNGTTGAATISGTPTVSAPVSVSIGYKQAPTNAVAPGKSLGLAVQPAVGTASVAQGDVGSAYSVDLAAIGSNQTGTWSASPLPAGLTLDESTGVISGSPTAAGTIQVVARFTQASGGLTSAPKTLPLTVKPVISTTTLPDGTRTLAYPSTQVTAAGSSAGTWSADNLPDGLAISSAGVITGKPTTVQTKNVTLRFTQTGNGGAPQVSKVVALEVLQAANPVISTDALTTGDVNAPYPGITLAATGPGEDAGTWTASPLPAGLSINPDTGAITGTPTASGTTAVVIGFTQTSTGLSASKTRNLVVRAAIATSSLPDGTRTLGYPSTQVAAVGTPGGTWTADNLPDGLSISAGGVISGTPTAVGTSQVTLHFTQTSNGGAPQVTRVVNLKINEAANPTITTTTLSQGTVGAAYSTANLAATGPGNAAGTWEATSTLPPGINLSSGGVFSGTPTASGTTSVTVTFTQTSTGLTASKSLSLVIKPTIATSTLPDGTRTLAYPSTQVTANGGFAGTWSADNLPAGLVISSGGIISGTPTAVGSTNVTLKFTQTGNGGAPQVTRVVTLDVVEVDPPTINTPASLPTGTAGTAYSLGLTASGPGSDAGTWEATTALPAGLTLSPAGVLAGTPTEAGSTPFTVEFTQTSSGRTATKQLTLVVHPKITTTSLADGKVQESYSVTLTAAGGAGTWTVSGLPDGLVYDSGTGEISGVPTTAGSSSVQIDYTSNGQDAATKTLSLDIAE